MTEAWLSGPVEGVSPMLQPVAHGLLNAKQQFEGALDGLTSEQLVARPGEIASVAYHVKHAIGSLDRLFTYARGESLSEEQRKALEAEGTIGPRDHDVKALLDMFGHAVERAMAQVRSTSSEILAEHRGVGRAQLPSTVIGLLFHGAEHTVRHAGQAVTTAKLVRSLSA